MPVCFITVGGYARYISLVVYAENIGAYLSLVLFRLDCYDGVGSFGDYLDYHSSSAYVEQGIAAAVSSAAAKAAILFTFSILRPSFLRAMIVIGDQVTHIYIIQH